MLNTIILTIGLFINTSSTDLQDAISNYKEFGYKCVPHHLHVEKSEYKIKDSTYVIQNDLNNIPWVTKVK